jgi:RsmE family RNA methyltransferase
MLDVEDWRVDVPLEAGVYVIWDRKDIPRYVGESCNLLHRFGDLERSVNHTFRRKVKVHLKLDGCTEIELSKAIAKQCGRNHILQIEDLAPLEKILHHAQSQNQKILWLEPHHGTPIATTLQTLAPTSVIALIGPEGGWSPRETALLESAATKGHLHRITLGPTILRIETATAAIAAILMTCID